MHKNIKYIFKKIEYSYIFWGVTLFLFLIFPSSIRAASLFLSPSNTEVQVGDTFTVAVNTDSQGTAINSASLDIKYDSSLVSVLGIGRSNSIFTLWAEEPSNSNGIVHLSGGLASPGYSGSSGNIIKITFKAKAVGQTKISPINGSVLANDGIGTNVLRDVMGTNIVIKQAHVKPATTPKTEVKKTEQDTEEDEDVKKQETVESFIIPIIQSLPDVLDEGKTLSFEGIGLPYGQVQVSIQKGKEDVEIIQVKADENGKFYITYKHPVLSGFYKIWARNLSEEDVLGAPSEMYYIEIVSKSSITILGLEISYKNIIIFLLFALVFTLGFLLKSSFEIKELIKKVKKIKI